MRYFLRLAYDGMPFHGWQRQPNAESVQQTVEDALSLILRSEIPIVGAGRTDTGVNARMMYAHFDVDEEIPDYGRLLSSLNRIVGPAISIQEIVRVHDDAHARFDATERTYKYFVTYEKTPFLKNTSWHSPSRLDIGLMNEAAAMLLTTRDFTSFAKLHSDSKTNICDLRHARWDSYQNEYGVPGIVFTIVADRFLRNMVRAVVGTLVDVGRGKMTPEDMGRVIAARDRCAAGTSMPPQALFLWDIKYPYL
ncbi:MAG: tRNA pseudouridine(38-40) synthase TruA [Bacteroides sp.]|nr:tRNA pseudouridine(38-40) synthase TruA [Bacteroides sp.]